MISRYSTTTILMVCHRLSLHLQLWLMLRYHAATSASSHNSVLLLSASHAHGSAANACASLGESLLPINKTFFHDDLVPLLRFQTFLGNFPSSQQFWVANEGNICQTVNAQGVVSSSRSCLQSLPALCTQGAAPKASAQPGTLFTVHSQDLTITGCVIRMRIVRIVLIMLKFPRPGIL